MNDAPRTAPEEINLVLEKPEISPEAWRQFINRLLIKQSMRRHPPQRTVFIVSLGGENEPEFILLHEPTKG